jgi:gamma-glutamylcyclotransferase (GGCT)/AIG2-like uncharacterized protein YtfP
MGRDLYFAFGSNMDRTQMKKRTPSAEYVGIGRIPNHDLVFNRKGTYRPGGVASIEPRPGIDVYGVVWSLSELDLAEMDRIEDPRAYQRVRKRVIKDGGGKADCNVYVAFPQGNIAPDKAYLELIIAAAQSADLPSHWIERLMQFRASTSQPAGTAANSPPAGGALAR